MGERLIAVTVIGNDRVGIVAGVTEVLYELGCNLQDATSTILRGHFSMTLVVEPPDGVDAAAIEAALEPVGSRLELVVAARPVADAPTGVAAPTHVVSVYGADRPGIVHRVTEVLADAQVNITDLTSRVLGGDDAPVYALMLEAVIEDEDEVRAKLEGIRGDLDLDVAIHEIEVDLL